MDRGPGFRCAHPGCACCSQLQRKHLDQATQFMDGHKYYEANLALKAIGDSITVDSVLINEPVTKTKS
ncbi:MAG: YfdX family protein [Rhodoplanes sp.]